MAPPNNLENRVTAVEKDVEAVRIVACAVDRDVAELRGEFRDFRKATTAGFNATREDINDLRTEMRAGFAKVDARFAKVDENFAKVDENFAKVDENFAKVDENFAKVDENFAKVDENFTGIRGVLDGCAAGYEHITKLLNTIIEQQGE